MDVAVEWKQEFQKWLQPFLEALGHKARRKWAPMYLLGLLAPLERKSIQPIAQQLAPTEGEQLPNEVSVVVTFLLHRDKQGKYMLPGPRFQFFGQTLSQV